MSDFKFELTDAERDAIEKLDWDIVEINRQMGSWYVEIENFSPAGEDLCETIWIEDGETLAQAALRWADSFDVDEHVELWLGSRGENGVPATARELVEDAEAIQEMFDNLAKAIELADRPKRKFIVPISWVMHGTVEVECADIHEAIQYSLTESYPLPSGDLVDHSISIYGSFSDIQEV